MSKSSNKRTEFHEALAPVMSASSPQVRRLTPAQARAGLIAVWALAVIIAGIALGRVMLDRSISTVVTESPYPVASASLGVTSVPVQSSVSYVSTATDASPITSARPTAVTQASAGTPFETVGATAIQSAEQASALQPGYTPFGMPQGTIGTDPVK